jgi:hypothetical protein
MTPTPVFECLKEDIMIIILGFMDMSDVLRVRSVRLISYQVIYHQAFDLYNTDMQIVIQSDEGQIALDIHLETSSCRSRCSSSSLLQID